jgi:hypothetical protein
MQCHNTEELFPHYLHCLIEAKWAAFLLDNREDRIETSARIFIPWAEGYRRFFQFLHVNAELVQCVRKVAVHLGYIK